MKITEEQFENHLLGILGELGYSCENGYEIAPETERAERKDYREVVLAGRLREKLVQFNPNIPAGAIEDAIEQIHRHLRHEASSARRCCCADLLREQACQTSTKSRRNSDARRTGRGTDRG